MSKIQFTQERPDSPEAQTLIRELDRHLTARYPIEARHGLSVARLVEDEEAFFILRYAGLPVGCGGVMCFGKEYVELKRMYVRPSYRGMGLGRALVKHLKTYAQTQGIHIVRLETGIHQESAIQLYKRMGYRKIPPFGVYQAGPLNLIYEKSI